MMYHPTNIAIEKKLFMLCFDCEANSAFVFCLSIVLAVAISIAAFWSRKNNNNMGSNVGELPILPEQQPIRTGVERHDHHHDQTHLPSSSNTPGGEAQLNKNHVEPIALRQWKKVLSWIAFHPDQVATFVDHRRQTILHHACLFRAPSYVIESILLAAPELASISNMDGELAIHWAVRLSLPNEVITLLLRAYPKAGLIRDNDGNTALSLIWERHQESILEALREGGPDMVKLLPSWKNMMYLFSCYYKHENEVEWGCSHVDADIPTQPLHAAAFCPCPPAVFPLLLRVYSSDIQIRDAFGHLPLAIAATSPAANRSCDVLTKIELLLREYPGAARVANWQGRLPLALAIQSRIPWDDGLHTLLQAEPQALSMRDRGTSLYPFMLAAAAETTLSDEQNSALVKALGGERRFVASELTTIYSLLRADPSQISLPPS